MSKCLDFQPKDKDWHLPIFPLFAGCTSGYFLPILATVNWGVLMSDSTNFLPRFWVSLSLTIIFYYLTKAQPSATLNPAILILGVFCVDIKFGLPKRSLRHGTIYDRLLPSEPYWG